MELHFDGSEFLPVQYERGGRESFAFSLRRSRFDDALLRYAARSGSEVVERRRAKHVHVGSNAVSVEAASPDGPPETFTCRIVVGADGMHSQVARSLNVKSRSHWPRRLGLIAHYEGVSGFDDWGEMHVGNGVYCGLNPLPRGLVNVGLVLPLSQGRGDTGGVDAMFDRSLARLPAVCRRLSSGKRVKPIRGIGPMSRRVEPVAGKGYVLVGDAAGFLDPFTGEGIYRSICGAEIAAEVIEDALRTGATRLSDGGQSRSVPDLSTYARKRRREFIAKERVTWIIQAALSTSPALELLCAGILSSSEARRVLGNVLGDTGHARELLRPQVVAALLKPW
jgi:flavin-dependent dehydrogenase